MTIAPEKEQRFSCVVACMHARVQSCTLSALSYNQPKFVMGKFLTRLHSFSSQRDLKVGACHNLWECPVTCVKKLTVFVGSVFSELFAYHAGLFDFLLSLSLYILKLLASICTYIHVHMLYILPYTLHILPRKACNHYADKDMQSKASNAVQYLKVAFSRYRHGHCSACLFKNAEFVELTYVSSSIMRYVWILAINSRPLCITLKVRALNIRGQILNLCIAHNEYARKLLPFAPP